MKLPQLHTDFHRSLGWDTSKIMSWGVLMTKRRHSFSCSVLGLVTQRTRVYTGLKGTPKDTQYACSIIASTFNASLGQLVWSSAFTKNGHCTSRHIAVFLPGGTNVGNLCILDQPSSLKSLHQVDTCESELPPARHASRQILKSACKRKENKLFSISTDQKGTCLNCGTRNVS